MRLRGRSGAILRAHEAYSRNVVLDTSVHMLSHAALYAGIYRTDGVTWAGNLESTALEALPPPGRTLERSLETRGRLIFAGDLQLAAGRGRAKCEPHKPAVSDIQNISAGGEDFTPDRDCQGIGSGLSGRRNRPPRSAIPARFWKQRSLPVGGPPRLERHRAEPPPRLPA
jgi:hypothetical protein